MRTENVGTRLRVKIVEEKLSVRDVEKTCQDDEPPAEGKETGKGPDIDLIYRQVEGQIKIHHGNQGCHQSEG